MNPPSEDYKVFSHYLNQYQTHKHLKDEKPVDQPSPKFLFRRINQNQSNLGDTVISEYLPHQNKEPSSSNYTCSHHDSEEQKQLDERPNEERLKLSEFAALMTRRELEVFKPIYFNVLIVGENSLGKSTFIEAILDKKFDQAERIKPATQGIQEYEAHREEGKIKLNLKLIDTPGYGSHLSLSEWYKMLKVYIKSKYKETMTCEEKLRRSMLKKQQIFLKDPPNDNKVHICLYFLTGPRIKRDDIIYMKKLQKYVNIIPILAKGDSYTVEEIKSIKLTLINQAYDHKIEWFDCLEPLKNAPDKLKILNEGPFGPSPPFLVISSLEKVLISPNDYVYGRVYNWGICNIENPKHCDFILLYNLLVGHYSLELIRLTNEVYYAKYKERIKKKAKLRKAEKEKRTKKIGCGVALGLAGGILIFELLKKKR